MKTLTHCATQPQRRSGASVGVITRNRDGLTEWLLQWNPVWQAMNLIGGRKEKTDANDLTCMIREIHEELFEDLSAEELTRLQILLKHNNDSYIREESDWQDPSIEQITRIGGAPFECDAMSEAANCLTHYTFHVYHVALHADEPLFQQDSFVVPTKESSVLNEWGSTENITRGVTAQGRPIGKTVAQIVMWIQSQQHSAPL